ncbi:MAG: NADH-quinone oxidoreductase subunit M [Anaerolineales bacterium]|nr:NADH-quinone oxidoreductase subunit M [Anaerolineales bacterium]
MESFASNPLNLLVFLPLIGAAIVAFLPKGLPNLARWAALVFSIPTLVIAIGVFYNVQNNDPGSSGFFYEYTAAWFPQIGAAWHLGVDGVSVTMVLLTAILVPLSILIAFEHDKGTQVVLALILFMQAAMMGVFITMDMVAFFIFWELGLVPMYFLINQWGGDNRRYASNKFFIYTMAGSLGLLLAIQLMAFSVGDIQGLGHPTFDIPTWLQTWPGYTGTDGNILGIAADRVKYLAFLGFFVAFSIKVPIWPFHTWLPDAHTEAPTAGSMLLAGVLLKQGAYGFIRFVIPLFPDVVARPYSPPGLDFIVLNFSEVLAFLAMMGIVLGAFAAWAQDDFKKLVAYSSVNHMGFVVMGLAMMAIVYATFWNAQQGNFETALDIAGKPLVDEDIVKLGGVDGLTLDDLSAADKAALAEEKYGTLNLTGDTSMRQDANVAMNGAVLQMFNHGLSAAAMFLLVGALYHKAHTRDLRRFGGLWHTIPVYATLLVFTSMASLGLPGLNGFTGEWLIVAGSFRVFPVLVLISMIGLLLTGAYILKGIQKVLHGPPNPEWIEYHEHHHSLEINLREFVAIAPLVVLMLVTGLYPNWILPAINDTISAMLAFAIG